MDTTRQLQVQELVLKYFEKVDDQTMSVIIDCFVYEGKTTNNQKVSKLVEQFLADNELTITYANYIYDTKSTNYFNRASSSEVAMIEQIKLSLLNISHNRFRKLAFKPEVKKVKLVEPRKVKMVYNDDQHEEVHIVGNLNGEYTLCGCLIDNECDTDYDTKEKVSCEHCIDTVKECKKIKI